MRVAIVYDPDPDLGPDPLDHTAKTPRQIGDFIDAGADTYIVWREWGDQFEDGSRTHVVSQGVWENVTHEQTDQILACLDDLEKESA